MRTKRFYRRGKKGALAAEYVATLYLLLLFLFFPLLNLGTICLRSFFLWFACNQAVMAGCKAKAWSQPITIGGQTYRPARGAAGTGPTNGLAETAAENIRVAFPGTIHNTRDVQIRCTAIPNTTGVNLGPVNGPLVAPPDLNLVVPCIVVTINGEVQPLIPMTLGGLSVPGLTTNMPMRVRAEAIFENPQGLIF